MRERRGRQEECTRCHDSALSHAGRISLCPDGPLPRQPSRFDNGTWRGPGWPQDIRCECSAPTKAWPRLTPHGCPSSDQERRPVLPTSQTGAVPGREAWKSLTQPGGGRVPAGTRQQPWWSPAQSQPRHSLCLWMESPFCPQVTLHAAQAWCDGRAGPSGAPSAAEEGTPNHSHPVS